MILQASPRIWLRETPYDLQRGTTAAAVKQLSSGYGSCYSSLTCLAKLQLSADDQMLHGMQEPAG